MKNKIRVVIVGVGNCASSLIQGVEYYSAATIGKTYIQATQRLLKGKTLQYGRTHKYDKCKA
jgi:myo-inositol-1-phosphate synthase